MADNIIQDIKDKLDIVEVITSYIATKKAGANYKAVCPFHNEKTSSLMISPQKQIWHCFGCGEGGDVFGFVMRYENMEFREALQALAQRAGVVLPERSYEAGQVKKVTEDLIRINNFTAKFYHKFLTSGAMTESASPAGEAMKYLSNRGLNLQTIERWEIGFAPDSFDALIKALQAKDVSKQDAIVSGVVAQNEKGQVYDRFRNRIVFPIHNYYGDVAGFTARIISSGQTDTAKYINSPETAVYNKSKILFGLYVAKEAIRKADEAVIVEGQMDAISAHQSGFDNTVATSGTAMTEDHLRLIGRLTKNLKFCFDSDAAGLQALRRAGELAMKMGFKVKVIVLPEGAKDPDELINTSPGNWKKAVLEAVWFIDYYLQIAEQQYIFGSIEQKQYLTEQVLPLLQHITNPLEQGHYLRLISERFAVTENELRATIKGVSAVAVASSRDRREDVAKPVMITQESIHEKEILGGLLVYPEYRAFVAEEGLPTNYISAGMQGIINSALLNEPLSGGGGEELTPAMESLANEAQFMVESSLENLSNNELALMRELKKSFYLFKLAGIKKELQDATTAIKKAESLHDSSAIQQFSETFAELSSKRYALEQKLES